MSDPTDLECPHCRHVNEVLGHAKAYLCEGCKRWNATPEFRRDPNAANEADSAAERERAFERMKGDA